MAWTSVPARDRRLCTVDAYLALERPEAYGAPRRSHFCTRRLIAVQS